MEITAQRESETVVAKANGRIDSSNSREFHSNLEAVSGVKFALCSMNDDSIREVFKISGFDKVIQIHGSQSEALAAISA